MSDTVTGQTQGFNALVTAQAAVMQNAASGNGINLDFTIGSVLRAICEGSAWLGLWLQGLILSLLALTRASTCVGPDLDSWMADFNFYRLPGAQAQGTVVYARATPTNLAIVPVGATVSSIDGTQNFTVIADTTQAAFSSSPAPGVYNITAGTASANVTVQNSVVGAAGNVIAGSLTVQTTAISGVDTVTNPSPISGGVNAESDPAFFARWIAYFATLARGTVAAIEYAASLTVGLQSSSVTQNYDYSGTYDPGSIYVVVDDGSGNPPSSFVQAAVNNISQYVAAGVRLAVYGAQTNTAAVVVTMVPQAGYTHAAVAATLYGAMLAYGQTLGLGETLSYAAFSAMCLSVQGVSTINSLTINSATADIATDNKHCVRVTSITIN